VDRSAFQRPTEIIIANEVDVVEVAQKKKSFDRLYKAAQEIEAKDAKSAKALGFMAASLVMTTLPHSKPDGISFTRRNGRHTLMMQARIDIGLPYGVIPRLLLAWVCTEAVRTKKRELDLGDSLTDFMSQLDMIPTGGRWGSIKRLREQASRLFTTSISCMYEEDGGMGESGFRLADSHSFWWHTKQPAQKSLFMNAVTLSEKFFEEITNYAVPFDMRALKTLKKSPLAIDLYIWLTYRVSYLHRETLIPWDAFQQKFGGSYPLTAQGRSDFRQNFITALKKVEVVYPDIRGKVSNKGKNILLETAKPHVSKRG
jgi:Plasmid encoded RepA protein